MAKPQVVIVGGGLAGLSATMKLAEAGIRVAVISKVPVKRSHSVCAQGGINSVNPLTRQQGDSEWLHLDDTVYGGDFLQHQPPVKEMCDWGPRVIDLLDRLGVPFNRTPEGFRDRRRFGGTMFKRTAFAGATTGQQMLYALDEQVRRWEARDLVEKFEYWEFLGPIIDPKGHCRGVVAQDMFSMEIRPFAADAVVLATGGCGSVFGRSTMSMICTGGAAGRAYEAGADYANGEFVQVHPTAIPGTDKLRLMSESARGEGGRIWVPRKPHDDRDPNSIPASERFYFLEERYPKYGNLVPRDIATREIFDVCVNLGLSVEPGRLCVYLDVTELSADSLKKLDGILEIYEKFQGVDPRKTPMKIFPAVHYSMGGLWVDYERNDATGGVVIGSPRNQQTKVPGLFVIGFNGAYLGAVFGYMYRQPQWDTFSQFVTAHGPFELTAVVMAGAAGLKLGFSLIETGGLSRGASLRRAGREAVPMMCVFTVLFLLAALIEGTLSPTTTPYCIKALVAVISSGLLMFYFAVLGFPKGGLRAAR